MTFSEKVKKIVSEIPIGQTMSYKEVAIKAGNKNAARAVGNIMKKNFDLQIPCHRVICHNGKLGGYNRGARLKKEKLLLEGALNN